MLKVFDFIFVGPSRIYEPKGSAIRAEPFHLSLINCLFSKAFTARVSTYHSDFYLARISHFILNLLAISQ